MYTHKVTRDIVYSTAAVQAPEPGSKDLLLDVYEPVGEGVPRKLPAVVFIHGGGFRKGSP
jgi:acetyl esterase/lipase